MSTTTPRTPVRIRATKGYKNLVGRGYSDEQAIALLAQVHGTEAAPAQPAEDPRITAFVAAHGVTREQAASILGAAEVASGAAAPVVAQPKPLTSAERADALVAQHGYGYGKGRVYLTSAVVEGFARVQRTGTPEIVVLGTEGRTVAVSLFRTDKGSVACQNLRALTGED